MTETVVRQTPVTLYRPAGTGAYPAVIVAHGFGGSRQMMDQIAVSIARQGFLVASLDLPGHGRNDARMSPDITRIEGTTRQLVEQVAQVTSAIAARPDVIGPISYVGHSMATDIVIRAAQTQSDVGAVIAISMYSPAVTPTSPSALLVVTGAAEGHLRQAGLDTVRLIDPNAAEGDTVTRGEVIRQSVVAPYVGHVGVLFSPTSLEAVTKWLRARTGQGEAAPLDRSGWVAGLLLAATLALCWCATTYLPRRQIRQAKSIQLKSFWLCLTLPIPIALSPAALPGLSVAGNAAFGTLTAIIAFYGIVQLAILHVSGHRVARPDILGTVTFLVLGCGIFALVLDRYGAAFLPTGSRFGVMLGLLLGTVPLMLADTALAHHAPIWRKFVARLVLFATLASAMALVPETLGLAFTTLPVLVLFFAVYGSLARWIAARRGPEGAALGLAITLAWSIAASTPLFAVAVLS